MSSTAAATRSSVSFCILTASSCCLTLRSCVQRKEREREKKIIDQMKKACSCVGLTYYPILISTFSSRRRLSCSSSLCCSAFSAARSSRNFLCCSRNDAISSSSSTSVNACSIVLPTKTSRIGWTSTSKSKSLKKKGNKTLSFFHSFFKARLWSVITVLKYNLHRQAQFASRRLRRVLEDKRVVWLDDPSSNRFDMQLLIHPVSRTAVFSILC